jgi:hypothetical protein
MASSSYFFITFNQIILSFNSNDPVDIRWVQITLKRFIRLKTPRRGTFKCNTTNVPCCDMNCTQHSGPHCTVNRIHRNIGLWWDFNAKDMFLEFCIVYPYFQCYAVKNVVGELQQWREYFADKICLYPLSILLLT